MLIWFLLSKKLYIQSIIYKHDLYICCLAAILPVS